jgi:hypothetical protein
MDENNNEVVRPVSAEDALRTMQDAMEHAVQEDCSRLSATWVNNFRLSYDADGAMRVVLSDAQDPTGRHIPRARVAIVMPLSMFEQLVEGVGPEYLKRIRDAKTQMDNATRQ